MKSRTIMTVAISLLLPAVLVGSVFAQEQTPTTTSAQTTTAAQAEAQKQAMQTRVQQRKDALKLKLTTVQQKRLQSRCKAAQGKITSEQAKVTGVSTSRTKVYANISTQLTNLEAKLNGQGLDTTALKADIAALKTKIDTFNTDLATYKDAVSDLAAMDCVADPTAFKASLETARTTRKQLRTDSEAIHAYIKDTIKPILATLRTQLEPQATTGGTN